jgi:hypothetical protein
VLFASFCRIGYGNQAPVTTEGRVLIVTAGLLSILLFAVVLGGSGFIISAIFDDMMSRIHLSFLTWPSVGCLLWGSCWIAWMLGIGYSADEFWRLRLGDEDFANNEDIFWFAFISTTTVGLGDFYLQPEVTFASDVLQFSLMFLVGFVFLASFLGKISEGIASLAPNLGGRLPARLAATNFCVCKPSDFGVHATKHEKEEKEKAEAGEKRIKTLQELLDAEADTERNSQSFQVEEKLLKGLLERIQAKLEHEATLLDLDDNVLKNILRYETSEELVAVGECNTKLSTLSNEVKEEKLEKTGDYREGVHSNSLIVGEMGSESEQDPGLSLIRDLDVIFA